MKLVVEGDIVKVIEGGEVREMGVGSAEAFEIISKLWLRSGWDAKYVYGFSWLGRPVIQLPDDMIRIQEVVYAVKPDVIVETGVAHGGSLVFYASLLKAMEKGRVIGVDVEIRPHNRQAIEAHEMFPLISLVEGDSVAPEILGQVQDQIAPGETVLVLLDSCHTKEHVLKELDAYSPLVTPGSYIVAMDGIMKDLVGAPRSNTDWDWNNPSDAALEWVEAHDDFIIEEPAFPFNEGDVKSRVTYWPNAFIKRVK
ncbi:Cephalosporin hydroxylase [Desulfatibacillum alkenivorans DSM 16219]|jgi:cephalosporin hydroxylase|uniref:Cephalosporin hydroxylase n=1 Tax=Desulfatibacillum alkenivorans DSM 16219 TaxID=1121393 RepID=A0A1M6RWG3_9BACT|nr:CmcI family methyltransferase [Desulfatibacillum alkenivorans]SHK36790.1 Cephalosporin hydroxylase [Desulfatibacillum alkenivorans DSM 16219]